MKCKKCEQDKSPDQFYAKDKTCKECRCKQVKANRDSKADYYREYDKRRFKEDARVKARHEAYKATEGGKAAHARAISNYRGRHPLRYAAHIIVNNALRDGHLQKPEAYESCGSANNIEGHHDDYTKPLVVRWLCECCHKEWHRNNQPIYA